MIDVDVEQRLGGLRARRARSPPTRRSSACSAARARARPRSSTRSPASRSPSAAASSIDGATLFDSAQRHRPAAAAAARRLRVPGRAAVPAPDGRSESALRPAAARADGALHRAGAVIELLGLARAAATAARRRSRAARSSASRSAARCSRSRASCCSTSRSPRSTSPRKTEILDYIERLRDELRIPIVYVSHSVAEITRLADTLVVLSDGKCVAVGDVDDVMGRLDLKPDTGRFEAGAVIEATVTAHDLDFDLTTLRFDGGELTVPGLDAFIGERVRARIRARDVSLALSQAGGPVHRQRDGGPRRGHPGGVRTGGRRAGRRRGRGADRADHTALPRPARIHVGQELYALVKAVSFDHRSTGYA